MLRRLEGKEELSRYARGVWVFASNARSGPVPRPLRHGAMQVEEETKCCALEAGTVMLRGRFLPVHGGVPWETIFYANLDC